MGKLIISIDGGSSKRLARYLSLWMVLASMLLTVPAQAADLTAPKVTSVTPAGGATGVGRGTTVEAVFSEPIKTSTLTRSTFTLVRQGTTTAVSATVRYEAASRRAILEPGAYLGAGKIYTARIKGGTYGVKDLAGRPLAVDKVWSFTTNSLVGPQGTYSDWSLPGSGYYNIDSPIFPSNNPRPAAGQVSQSYFYASQFAFTDGTVGYIGIQTDARGKRAVFSIWDATGASCSAVAGAICQRFDGEGEGWQTMIPYNWVAGHSYRTRVWAVRTDASGEWWLGAIIDDTLGTEAIIGSIHVPIGRGRLSGHITTWTEWYGPHVTACNQLPISVIFFGPPRANGGTVYAGSARNWYGRGLCPSSLSTYGEWTRQRNGWGD